ncbi:hypothetical protein [Emticicia sp. BO119]|uniref:hypothetical protein n=1 Tax=Emticicia sp. BO119 TaxID=2757768 RepID=UPI0015F04CC1|nr:hypothetical protein [Emticicia sp. BO119]MBA4849508.1 hypothetical protein [Emticicia sp. BO119]
MKKIFCYLLVTFLTTSCVTTTYIPFTEDIRQNLEQQGVDLKKIQFYSEKNIVLKRYAEKNTAELQQGSLSRNSTTIRERIAFSSGATKLAGVCKATEQGTIAIQFEEGELDKKKIMFYRQHSGIYIFDGENKLIYDDVPYEVIEGYKTMLMLSSKDTKDFINSDRQVKGLYVKP